MWRMRMGEHPAVLAGPDGERVTLTEDEAGGDVAWRRERYGSGWRFALVPPAGGDPLLWYEPHRVRWGGRVVVAPERELALSGGLRARRTWTLSEEDAAVVRATKAGNDTLELEASPGLRDAALLVSFVALFALLDLRTSEHIPSGGA
jgi:hypothetical protein